VYHQQLHSNGYIIQKDLTLCSSLVSFTLPVTNLVTRWWGWWTIKKKEGDAEEVDKDKETKSKKKRNKDIPHGWQFLNMQKPILLCKLKEIIKERYVFYHKSLTNVWEDYLDIKHFYIKVQLKFKVNFFVPKKTSFISNSQYQPFHDILTSKELRFP